MSNPAIPSQHQTPCRYLRSKEMFYQTAEPDDEAGDSGLYWCTKNQECFGPDGAEASKAACCAGRSCYVG